MADQTTSTHRALLRSMLQRGELSAETFYPPWKATPDACAQALADALEGDLALRFIVTATDSGGQSPADYQKLVLGALGGLGVDFLSYPLPKRTGELLVARPEALSQSARAGRERAATRDVRRQRCSSGRVMHETHADARARTLPAEQPYLCEECNWWHTPA